uniref:Synaptopodin n=1 Tax=Leptobrachium leishanense TaxID=445787 RepID=A0A8C5PBG9_9ANUR
MEVGMMLNSSLSSQTSVGSPVESRGFSHDFIDTENHENSGHEPWIDNYDTQDESLSITEENVTPVSLQENSNEDYEIVTPHLAIVEEDQLDIPSNRNVETNGGENLVIKGPTVESQKSAPRPVLISAKSEGDDLCLDLNHLSSTKVSPSLYQSKKAYLLRNVSLTEQELKEAQRLSDSNDAQLSPTQGSCSRGVLLFHRRRQRLKAFEQHNLAKSAQLQGTQQTHSTPETKRAQHGLQTTQTVRNVSLTGSGRLRSVNNMDETSSDAGYEGEPQNKWEDFPPIDKRAPSPSASEEDKQGHLSAYLKETLVVSMSNGLVDQTKESEATLNNEQKVTQNGTQNKQYCEVHLTLSKPASIANRTAKPFGAQQSAKKNLSSSEISPVTDLPPPPTYAETLSSPPPVTRIVSPPAYSALYPIDSQHFKPVLQIGNQGDARVTPPPKTGILEEIGARRGARKSMFTFIEKSKMTPNPDLLSMVQSSDERQKSKDQVDVPTEEEHFALGAEASNFQNNKTLRAEDNAGQNDKVPNWSSSLKSPGFKSKPPPAPIQTLTEAKGKGAELFARRQSRMERFVVESPSPYDCVRSPSPTMSLPPSWTFVSNVQSPATQIGRQIKNNQRSPKLSSATKTSSESIQSQKELEISKRQPYQLQSSLFIFSPNRDPLSSLPKAAPPPKPMVMEPQRFKRQSSCPTSPVISPPALYSPSYVNSVRSPSATMSPSTTSTGRQTPTNQVSPASPVPFSNTGVAPSRTKTIIQAPRPSFSARNAGLESQKSPNQRVLQHRGSLDSWGTSAMSFKPVYEERPGIQSPPPFRSMSPAWSDRTPSPFKVENDMKSGNQMKALLARNIINAAKRKSTSPFGLTSPLSPTPSGGIWSPTHGNGNSLPETPRARRSPTFSEISVESEESGTRSPGFRSYTFSPKGWYGSMRLKRESLPNNQAFTYTP